MISGETLFPDSPKTTQDEVDRLIEVASSVEWTLVKTRLTFVWGVTDVTPFSLRDGKVIAPSERIGYLKSMEVDRQKSPIYRATIVLGLLFLLISGCTGPTYHDGYEPGGVHHGSPPPVMNHDVMVNAKTFARRYRTANR